MLLAAASARPPGRSGTAHGDHGDRVAGRERIAESLIQSLFLGLSRVFFLCLALRFPGPGVLSLLCSHARPTQPSPNSSSNNPGDRQEVPLPRPERFWRPVFKHKSPPAEPRQARAFQPGTADEHAQSARRNVGVRVAAKPRRHRAVAPLSLRPGSQIAQQVKQNDDGDRNADQPEHKATHRFSPISSIQPISCEGLRSSPLLLRLFPYFASAALML